MELQTFILGGALIYLALLIPRIVMQKELKIGSLGTANPSVWLYLHVFYFIIGGYFVDLSQQWHIICITLLFELLELSVYYAQKTTKTNLFMGSSLSKNPYKVSMHNIIMNISSQIVGLSLSNRLDAFL